MAKPPEFVFLIGAARSGTKFLRDTIAASRDVAAVPYDINYVWRHGNENCPHDELQPEDISDRTANHIRRSVEELALRNHGPETPRIVLEKTVSNTLRVEVVRRVFPEARFIYLERGGLDVTESAYRQWTAPADRGYLIKKLRYFPIREWRYARWYIRNSVLPSGRDAIWGPRFDGIVQIHANEGLAAACAHQWSRSVLSSRIAFSEEDCIATTYKTLPSTISSISAWLDICDSTVADAFRSTFAPQSGWPGRLTNQDQASCVAIVESVDPSPH